MAFGESGAASATAHLRSHRGPRARRGVRHAVHGDHSRGGAGRARGGLHPGHRRRPDHDDRRRSVCGRARRWSCWCWASRRCRRCWSPCRSSPRSGSSGDYGTGAAVIYTVLLFVAGMLDNVLKPLLLGRGVDAPMPVILLGALGGLASARHPRHVRRRDLAGPGLPDLHVVGGHQSGHRAGGARIAGCGLSCAGMPVNRLGCAGDWRWQAAALLSACTTLGPDFKRPQVPWLADWTGGSLEPLAAAPRGAAASRRCSSGGATSTIRCSTSWSPRRSA